VETIAPASPVALRKKVHAAVKKAKDADGDVDLDKLDDALATLDLENAEGSDDPDSDGSDDGLEFTAGDALGKALALVKQVCKYQIFEESDVFNQYRFACHLKLARSSSLHAFRLESSLLNFFYGYAPVGHHCISFSNGLLSKERYNNVYSPSHEC
jgi:hypothetical protein